MEIELRSGLLPAFTTGTPYATSFNNWRPLMRHVSGDINGPNGTLLTFSRQDTTDGRTATLTATRRDFHNNLNCDASNCTGTMDLKLVTLTDANAGIVFRFGLIGPLGGGFLHGFYPDDAPLVHLPTNCPFVASYPIRTFAYIHEDDLAGITITYNGSGFTSAWCTTDLNTTITFTSADLVSYAQSDERVISADYTQGNSFFRWNGSGCGQAFFSAQVNNWGYSCSLGGPNLTCARDNNPWDTPTYTWSDNNASFGRPLFPGCGGGSVSWTIS